MKVRDFFSDRIFTFSNFLSISRILLLPIVIYFLNKSVENPIYKYHTLVGFFIIMLTDFFDGYFARKFGQETQLGQYLDPIADKFVILIGIYWLCMLRDFPWWLFIFIVIREILATIVGAFLALKRDVIGKPNYWGKMGVTFAAVSAIFYIWDFEFKAYSLIPLVFTFAGGFFAYGMKYWKIIFNKS